MRHTYNTEQEKYAIQLIAEAKAMRGRELARMGGNILRLPQRLLKGARKSHSYNNPQPISNAQ